MNNIRITHLIVLLLISFCAGCASSTSISSESTSTKVSGSHLTVPSVETNITESEFINLIIEAINENDTEVLIKYYDSVYGGTTDYEAKQISEGLKLYHQYFKNERIEKFEFGEKVDRTYDTPNTTGKQYFLISTGGIKRDILIKCFAKDKFKFCDPLLIYGPEINSRVNAYVNAIKNKDINYIYDYIRMSNEDSEAAPYSEPNHNKEYEQMAKKTIQNYEKKFENLAMKWDSTGEISDVCSSSSLRIEYKISGTSKNGEMVEHTIYGTFEFPMFGINDSWF